MIMSGCSPNQAFINGQKVSAFHPSGWRLWVDALPRCRWGTDVIDSARKELRWMAGKKDDSLKLTRIRSERNSADAHHYDSPSLVPGRLF